MIEQQTIIQHETANGVYAVLSAVIHLVTNLNKNKIKIIVFI
jgi:hypothetical protein